MKQYLDLLRDIQRYGTFKGDRTGTGTQSLFGAQMRFDLAEGFPLLTTKKVFTKAIIHELLWFIAGDTNIKYLKDHGVSIWDEWADENGDLGPVYGKQWRSWPAPKVEDKGTWQAWVSFEIDQLAWVQDEIRKNPNSRRLIVSAWNPAEVDQMALPPCHCLFQFNTRPMSVRQRTDALAARVGMGVYAGKGEKEATDNLDASGAPSRYLDCQLYQRSADVFLGVPFNIASYALLTHMMAQATNTVAGHFIHTFGDVHIYNNHREQVDRQLTREPRALPRLVLNPEIKSIFDFKFDDISIEGYLPANAIKGEVSV